MSGSDSDDDLPKADPRLRPSRSQTTVYDNFFGGLNGPMHRDHHYREPLDIIESEYESIQSEIDGHIHQATQDITDANKRYEGQVDRLKEERVKIYEGLTQKRKSLLHRINNSNTRRQFDKITFFLSLIIVQYKSYVLGKYPDYGVYFFNFILMIFLLLWRNVSFRMGKTHYYMFEFCYFANVILYVFIFIFPTSRTLYLACFAFCCGPVGWALALVGCSFVLHSVEQLTNCFIHFTPMVLMVNLHWRTQHNPDRGWELYDAKQDVFSWQFVKDYFSAAFGIYLIWAVFYYVCVFILFKKRIKDRNYETLVAYHVTRNTVVGKFVTKHGPRYQGLIYLVSHMVIVSILFLFTLICYFNVWINVAFMVLASSVSFWNGATYYMDYFSKKYEINLKKLDDLHVQVSDEIVYENKSPSKEKVY